MPDFLCVFKYRGEDGFGFLNVKTHWSHLRIFKNIQKLRRINEFYILWLQDKKDLIHEIHEEMNKNLLKKRSAKRSNRRLLMFSYYHSLGVFVSLRSFFII